jgi:hypothetical protein
LLLADSERGRVVAARGRTGRCPYCHGEVVPVCGDRVTHHWRHKTTQDCDSWWEETPWHLGWKARFPEAWWEKVQYAEDGEKHVADIKMPAGLVIEFQHSPLSADERVSRERFYQAMIWVVDGSRLKRPYTRFVRAVPDWRGWRQDQPQLIERPEKVFPEEWSDRPVPVVFDWGPDGGDDLVWLEPATGETEERKCFRLERDRFVRMMVLTNMPQRSSQPASRVRLSRGRRRL